MINLQVICMLWFLVAFGSLMAFGIFYGGKINSEMSMSYMKWLGAFTATQLFAYLVYLSREYWSFKNIAAEANHNIEQKDYDSLSNSINRYEQNREKLLKVARLFNQHYAAVMEFLIYYVQICKKISVGEWLQARALLNASEDLLKIVRKNKESPFSSNLSHIISCYEQNKIAILCYTDNQYNSRSIKNKKLEAQTKSEIETSHSKTKSLIKGICIIEQILVDREKIKEFYYSNNIYDIYNRIIYDTVLLGLYSAKNSNFATIKSSDDRVAVEKIIEKYKLDGLNLLEDVDEQNSIVDAGKIMTELFKQFLPNLDLTKDPEMICDMEPKYMSRVKTPQVIFYNNVYRVSLGQSRDLEYFQTQEEALEPIKEHLKYQYHICLYNIGVAIVNQRLFTSSENHDYLYRLLSKIHFDKTTETHMWFSHKKLVAIANMFTRGIIEEIYRLTQESSDYTVIIDCIEILMIISAKADDLDEFNKLNSLREEVFEAKGLMIKETNLEEFQMLTIYVKPINLIYAAANISYAEFFINPWESSFI